VVYFYSLCAFPSFFPQHEPSMRAYAKKDTADVCGIIRSGVYPAAALVGNGPYRLAEWSFKRRVRMEANEFYWDKAPRAEPGDRSALHR